MREACYKAGWREKERKRTKIVTKTKKSPNAAHTTNLIQPAWYQTSEQLTWTSGFGFESPWYERLCFANPLHRFFDFSRVSSIFVTAWFHNGIVWMIDSEKKKKLWSTRSKFHPTACVISANKFAFTTLMVCLNYKGDCSTNQVFSLYHYVSCRSV